MKKKYVKFIDNGGFVLFPVSGLLVIGAVAIGAQILIGITLFVQLMLIAGYYTFKTNSIFREPLVRHSIEYCRIEAEEGAFILNTRISITAIGNIGFDESNMTLKELYEGLKKNNDCYAKFYFVDGVFHYDNGCIQFTQSFSSSRVSGFDLLSCIEKHSELFELPLSQVHEKLIFYTNKDLLSVSSPFARKRHLYLLDLENYFNTQYFVHNNGLNLNSAFGSDQNIVKHLFALALLTGDDLDLKYWKYPKGFVYGATVNDESDEFDICHDIEDKTYNFNLIQNQKPAEGSSISCISQPGYEKIRNSIEEIDHKIADGCTFSIISTGKWESVYKKEILSLLDADKSVSKENQDRIMQILSQLLNDLEVKANHEREEKIDITISALEKIAAMDGLNDDMDIFSSKNTGKAGS